MALEGFQPFVLRTFGGLCTSIDRLSLGVGMSPNCTNVRFDPGTVGSRYGYEQSLEYGATAIAAASPIYAIKPFVPGQGYLTLLYLTAAGATPSAPGAGAGKLMLRLGATDYTELAGTGCDKILTMKADTLFGRVYIAIDDPNGTFGSNGGRYNAYGRSRIYMYDGSISIPPRQIGVGAPAWKPDAGHYVNVVAGAGGLAEGDHYYAWLFIGKDGYISAIGGGGYFNVPAGGATTKLNVVGAPIGSNYVAGRILAIAPAGDVNLFWVPNKTVLWDNTTTTLAITLSEDELLGLGEPARPYATVRIPSAPEGVCSYADRLVVWGARDKPEWFSTMLPTALGAATFSVIGLPNLDFKGGSDAAFPGYWTALGAGRVGFGAGANNDTLLITTPTLNHGISVTANIDSLYLRPGSWPNLRVRYRWSRATALTTGNVRVSLALTDSSGGAIAAPAPYVDIAYTSTYDDFIVAVSQDAQSLVSLGTAPVTGATATMTVKCTQAFSAAATLEIDWIEIYDANDFSYQHTLYLSRSRDPETFDYSTGILSVGADEGERIRTCFRLRDSLYIAKDRSLYVTRDTGDEPVAWPVDLVDKQAGTPSLHGIGYGDGWVVILSRTGLILFDGATPQVISQEITPTWNTIDWTDPCFAWVVVDPSTKQIKVGVRTTAFRATGAQENNLLLCLDYTEGFGNPVPSGQGRKWSIDTVKSKTGAANVATYHHGAMALDAYGTPRPIYSMSATPDDGTVSPTRRHNIVYQKPDETSAALLRNDWPQIYLDNAGTIDATYETAPIGEDIGRSTFDKVVMRARGDGTLSTSLVNPDASVTALQSATLISAPTHDIELGANNYHTSEGVRVNSNTKSAWFSIRRIGVFLKNSTYGFLRGKVDSTSA